MPTVAGSPVGLARQPAACLKHSIPGDFNLATVADIELLLSEQRLDVRR